MCNRIIDTGEDVIATGIPKGDERYVVVYRERDVAQARRVLARWATDPSLSFTWQDAAKMSQQMRHGST